MDKEEFRRRRAAIKAKSDKLWGDIEEHRTEENASLTFFIMLSPYWRNLI